MSSASSIAEPWAADEPKRERRATWLELFFDLVFAAAVAEVGGLLGEHYDFGGLLRFLLPFWLIWWAWAGHTFFSTRFDTDDLGQRLLTVGQMFLIAVMAANTVPDLGSREAAGFAAAYAGLRLLLSFQYLRVRHAESRLLRHAFAAGIGGAAVLWLASSLAPRELRFALWAAALAVELLTPLIAGRIGRDHPPDPAHLPERFGLFTLIMLGESVIGTMAGMKHQEAWTAAAASSAALGLGTTFALWWAYFDVARGAAPRAVDPAERKRLQIWLGSHLPLNLGLVVTGVGIEYVVAHAGGAALSIEGSWLLAGGLGLVAVSLAAIGWSEPAAAVGSAGRIRFWPVLAGGTAALIAAPRLEAVWLLALLFAGSLAFVLSASRSFGDRVRDGGNDAAASAARGAVGVGGPAGSDG